MTLNETVDMLKSLKLNGMAESYNEMMNLQSTCAHRLNRLWLE